MRFRRTLLLSLFFLFAQTVAAGGTQTSWSIPQLSYITPLDFAGTESAFFDSTAERNNSKDPLLPAAKPKRVRRFDYKTLARKSRIFPDLATTKPPLRPSQKFRLFISASLSPAALGGATFGAGLGMARDNLHGYGQGMQGYGKRVGASLATSASTQFFGTFVLASVFHQDPRIFVRGDGGLRQSVKYGLRRLVITPTDSSGEAINWSGLGGPLAAQWLANSYLPDEERNVGRTFQRYGTYLALRAGMNVLKEYWPTIVKRLKQRQRPPAGSPPPQQSYTGSHRVSDTSSAELTSALGGDRSHFQATPGVTQTQADDGR